MCLDTKSLLGIGGRLGIDEYRQFTLNILAKTEKRIKGTFSA